MIIEALSAFYHTVHTHAWHINLASVLRALSISCGESLAHFKHGNISFVKRCSSHRCMEDSFLIDGG